MYIKYLILVIVHCRHETEVLSKYSLKTRGMKPLCLANNKICEEFSVNTWSAYCQATIVNSPSQQIKNKYF